MNEPNAPEYKILKQTVLGWERLVRGAVMNVYNRDGYEALGWGIVSKMLGVGSHHALEVCTYFGLDGHAYVQPGDRLARL